ncbi:MAG TPA: acVLRF1 family peptidyl-tRNA hydrolase [Micromonosporaceae bacterium]
MSSKVRPAAGGGRWVDVDPERLVAWLNAFAVRHGGYQAIDVDESLQVGAVQVGAGDATMLELYAPPGAPQRSDVEEFVVEALRPRRLGLLLARQASVAVGIADGPTLVASRVDTFYVQSRTAAGGWSQQRYARRRVNQAKAAAEGAAELAVRLLLPELPRLAALVTGGDRRTVEAILADPRLAPALPLRSGRFLAVGEPRRSVLEESVGLARQVRILVRDPEPRPPVPTPAS